MQKRLLLVFLTILQTFTFSEAIAQTVVTIGAGSQSATQSNSATGDSGPMYRSTATSNFVYSRHHYLYTQAELATAGVSGGVNITKLAWFKDLAASTNSPATFQIWIKNSTKTTVGAGGQNWADLILGSTQVYNNNALTMTAPAQWHEFNFSTPFLYTGGALEISVNFDMSSGTSPWTSAGFSWKKDPETDRTLSYVGSTAPGATLPNLRTVRPQIQITYVPAGPCTAPPTAGTASSSITTTCPNTDFTLNVTGNTIGAGQTYQWESSPTGAAPWTAVGPSSTSTSLTTSQLSTTFYRLGVTCSGQTAFTNSVQVTTNATPVSGTFTINKNALPSATNFVSFAAAITSIECGGVNGPTVFNVVANTGPYNEEVIIPVIPGTSATNTVTFNGNNNVVTFANTASNRSVFRLDGSDFVNLNGFNIQPTDLVYGWGIHLQNGADNNTITNNTITIASTSTTEANSVGIVFSNSTTTVITAGNTGSNNVISNNTISGGYKGIHLNHEVATASNNQIINNTITDFYADGILVNAAKGTLIEGNNISRPTRVTVTTFAGIEIGGNSQQTLISKNRIHNSHGGASSKTGTVYGVFITAADAPAGLENRVQNNLIYDISNTGTVYALYNSGSDGAYYFHNTINLDNPLNTGINRGFFQTTAATNIRFVNNIVSIVAGATGAKHTLYFATTTSGITSNGNVLYLTGGASTSGIGFFTSNRVSLADWQTASSQDANSLAVNPTFANIATGDFTPTNVAVNNSGQPGTGVTNDIMGLTRNPNAPDPGAYEFLNLTNDLGITAITSPNSNCGLSATETITVIVTNFGTLPQSNIPVSYTINAGTPVTAIIPGPLAPGANFTYSFTTTANMSAQGGYNIVASTNMTGDLDPANNSTTKLVSNARFTTLPQLNFETAATGIGNLRLVTNSRSSIFEDPAASLGTGSTKGLVLDGMDHPGWVLPVTVTDPWTVNPEHFAGAYLCFDPQGATNPGTPLWLSFDLKQLYKGANANTNFRVTVNGTAIGGNTLNNVPANTYRPPFDGIGGTTNWTKVYLDLTPYKNLPGIEIGFESSAKEAFASGAGTANLIDNIQIVRLDPTGTKDNVLASSVNVYPNPSNGAFSITLPQGKTFEMELTDLTGKVISRQSNKGNAAMVELKNNAKGIYILKITSEGKMATKKLIVQ